MVVLGVDGQKQRFHVKNAHILDADAVMSALQSVLPGILVVGTTSDKAHGKRKLQWSFSKATQMVRRYLVVYGDGFGSKADNRAGPLWQYFGYANANRTSQAR